VALPLYSYSYGARRRPSIGYCGPRGRRGGVGVCRELGIVVNATSGGVVVVSVIHVLAPLILPRSCSSSSYLLHSTDPFSVGYLWQYTAPDAGDTHDVHT
jgi:hypothetical protein